MEKRRRGCKQIVTIGGGGRGKKIFESIKAEYIKSLDMKVYFKLESAITKRLYSYLDKKRYGNKLICSPDGVLLFWFCHEASPTLRYHEHIKMVRECAPGHSFFPSHEV